MWVPGYSVKVYAPSVGGGGQQLLQGSRTWLRATRVAVSALCCYAVRHPVNAQGSLGALFVLGDDGAEVCQPCCAAFPMLYPECVVSCHFWAQLSG